MFLILERSFLALDWDPELKKRYFDDSAAEVSCLCCFPFQEKKKKKSEKYNLINVA